MSTLSGVSSKGEKGKSKFQSLDINNLYNKTSRGESSEPHTQKSTVPRKHGMQSLGKVPSTRRPPANLPSLKSEHSGNDPTVSLVPTGGTGWGSKPGETGPTPTTQQPQQPPQATTTANSINHSLGTSVPAVVGTPAPQTNTISQPPTQGPVNVKPTVGNSSTSGGDKTWSSVMSGAETGPSFLAHQSPQFQQEFPSLSGEGAAPAPPVKGPIGQEGQYGPGPSLRPQTEGSWIQGGATRAPPPVTTSNTATSPVTTAQHPFLPQESVPGGNRNNLGQFGSGTVPGGPPPQPPQIPSQFKGVVPPFMLNRGGGFPNVFPANFNSSTAPMRPRFHVPPENRFVQGSRQPPIADPEDLIPRPIIREEDLHRMDEISRDTGWATQDDIDYNQKLAFSDDEGAGLDEDKDTAKDNATAKSSPPPLAKDDKDLENEKEVEKQSDRLSATGDKPTPSQPWQGRGPPSMPTLDYRGQPLSRITHPLPVAARGVDILEEHWKEKRRHTLEKVAAITEKAKQRREEEEKRYEESRSKSHLVEIEQKNKKGKEDITLGHSGVVDQQQHSGAPNISEWEKDSMPTQVVVRENKEAVENFRQMTQLDNRPNFNREKERERDMRGERDVQTFQRFQSNLPPRFQKQMNDRPGNQQFMRHSPNNVTNSMQNFESRWSISNSHNASHFSGKQTNNSGRRNETEIIDREIENRDRMKENDDKDRRERLTPEPNMERDRRDREELEWEGRRGNSSWDHNRHYDDKYQGRRDVKKSSADAYSNKPHKYLLEERENEWRDRPQRPESRERPDRPPRPDSRDSRTSRESRNSRDSMREESRAIPELMNNDYPWADMEYEKDIREDKPRKKENYKDEKRDNLPRREGHVPGPITREKMEAYEHKQNLAKAEKKEVIGSNNNVPISGTDDESRNNKLQSTTASSMGGAASNTVSWADSTEEGGSNASNQTKEAEQPATQASRTNDDVGEKVISSKEIASEKKKDSAVKEKDKSSRGGRGGRGGSNRASGNYPAGSNYGSVFYRGSTSWNSKESRRGSNKSGSQKQGQWNASESEASADEVSASTESGKEDKKTERKQIPRSPRPGERKRDKEERNRESKKSENEKNRQEKKQSNVGQGGSGYESGGSGRKEGFAPRGEPSRRGRGGYRTTRGNLGNVAGHYGPPGNKSPFPSHGQHDSKQEDETQSQSSGTQQAPVSDLDASTADEKSKQKQQTHVQPPVSGVRQNKDNISSRIGKNKSNSRKGGSGGEEWETTSEASDSESKNLKHSKIQQKMDKSKVQRPVGDKRGQFSTAHMNGRPSRSEDNKDNGFQEVRSKKVGKETRPLGKEEPKRGRGKEGKGKGLQGTNASVKAVQSKSYIREWSNNKPPRLQRLENNRKQQHQQQQQDVSEMNKINQNVSALLRDVACPAGAPPPPPSVNAWDKPITATLRTTPPPTNNPLHLASTISNNQDKSAIDLNEHGQSGASSQTSSPSAEKALTKMSRDAVEKALLDGTTPPVQTIIFENTNYKVPSEMAMKAKYSSLKGQRIDKTRGKLEEDLEGSSHGISLGGFKTGTDIKQGDNKPQEPIQIPMSFNKNEDNADMKLDFAFDSDLSQLTEDKTNLPRSIHLGQTSAADLNQKIASVKKVWETPGAMMEHQHHVDENHGVVSTSSSFTPNFGSAVDAALDHTAAHQVDDSTFTNSDVYNTGPPIQGNSGAYSSGGTNIIKQDPNSASTNVKPQPQQATVMSSGIGTHSASSLSSPPPAFTQQGHFNYQAQYSNMPAIPSPPAVLINSATGAQQVNHQGELFHSFPLHSGPTVIGNQAAAARSGFSQYAYSLSQGIGQTSAAAFSQQSLYHPLQPAAPPPPPNAPPDVFSSLSQYRIQPSAAYGQSQQLSNNPSTVLITSSSNSLMSASVKSSPQPPIGAPIGTKGGYQSSAHPSPVQLGFIQYETQMLPQNFLQNSQLVQQRHGGSNVVPAIQPPTSYYSSSAGGQTGLFQPGSSILASTGSQPGLHSAATAFGMQGFGTQSAGNPAAAPSSSNPVGVPSFTTQMGHFRAQAPATYLKAGNPTGQHPSDASKSPSNNQDVLSVFTTGGQIPSPKSRSGGGASGGGSGGSGGNAPSGGGTNKQVGPPPASQQPSPTQSHHKFTSYQSQQNLVLQQQGSSQSSRGGPPQMTSGGVRNSGGNSGAGGSAASSGSLSANSVLRYPNPIQRPPVDLHHQSFQQQQHQQQQIIQQVAGVGSVSVTQPRHNRLSTSRQQHIKIANQYYPQQGNPVKLDTAGLVEGKADTDKLQENNTTASKQDKGKEETSSNNEQ